MRTLYPNHSSITELGSCRKELITFSRVSKKAITVTVTLMSEARKEM